MGIGDENIKLIENNISGINTEIKVNGQRLVTFDSVKYMGSVIIDEASRSDNAEISLV